MRNLKLRNLGLGNRCAQRALFNAYKETVHSYASEAHAKSATKRLVNYLNEKHAIKDLRHVKREHIIGFAKTLLEECDNEELSVRTAKNYLSAINCAFANARLDEQLTVHPVKHAGFPTTSGVTKVDRSSTDKEHQLARSIVSPRLSTQMLLQRLFGLRFKESCLLNCYTALQQALQKGYITVEYGTKGGRPRTVSITSLEQVNALMEATFYQRECSSLIPEHLSWAQYQDRCYREIAPLENYSFHSERHHFAQDRYHSLMGVECPVKLGMGITEHIEYLSKVKGVAYEQVKQLDIEVRGIIAQDLGHNRVSITRSYLG